MALRGPEPYPGQRFKPNFKGANMQELSEFERASIIALTVWESREVSTCGALDKSSRFYDMLFEAFENMQIAAELDTRIRQAFGRMKPDVEIKPA